MRNIYLLLSCFIGSIMISQNLDDHRLLHYNFNGNTNDDSGNNHHGVPFGVTYGLDRFGNPNAACYFNGIDNYVNFPNITALKPNLPVSFSFWINYQSNDYSKQVVFNTSFEEDRCTGVWFNSSLVDNAHAINFGNGNYFYAPESRNTFLCYKEVAVNFWRHVIVVVNSETDMKMYIGFLDNPGIYSGTGGSLVYSDTPGCIGRHDRNLNGPPGYFNGLIDDFMYWDRALTLADVNALQAYSLSTSEVDLNEKYMTVYFDDNQKTLELFTNLEGIKQVSIYNTFGQEVAANEFKSSINVAAFASGMYFVRIKNNDTVLTKKVIIR